MAKSNKTIRTCKHGHQYERSSDCPICPICERKREPNHEFMSLLAAPARRALENIGITSLDELATYSEKEILKLHGMGPASMLKLRSVLHEAGLSVKL